MFGAGEGAALLGLPGVAPGAPAGAEGGRGLVQLPGQTQATSTSNCVIFFAFSALLFLQRIHRYICPSPILGHFLVLGHLLKLYLLIPLHFAK